MSLNLCIIFLLFFGRNAKAFTTEFCEYRDSENCHETFYDGSDNSIKLINDFYQQNSEYEYLLFTQTNDSDEIIVKLEGINPKIKFDFKAFPTSHVTLQTNLAKFSEDYPAREINSGSTDFIIESLAQTAEKTLFQYKYFYFKTVAPKDPKKPLYLLNIDSYSTQNIFNLPTNFACDQVFIAHRSTQCYLDNSIEKSLTVTVSPSSITRDSHGSIDNFVYITCPDNITIRYGNNKIDFEYINKKTVTLFSETRRISALISVRKNSIITVEDDVNSNDLISPYISQYLLSNTDLSTITGNWPVIHSRYIRGEYLEDGTFISSSWRDIELQGSFYFSATNFPFFRNEHVSLFLTEKESSINMVYYELNYNITIEAVNKEVDTFFTINGLPIQTRREVYDNGYLRVAYIISESPKLTIFANTRREVEVLGKAKVVYKQIDSSFAKIKSGLSFQNGGTITVPFGVDYGELSDKISALIDEYLEDHPTKDRGNITVREYVDVYVDFASEKLSAISEIMSAESNKVYSPVTISLIDSSEMSSKNTILLNRREFPISAFYENGLNEEVTTVCLESGKIDMSQWNIKVGTNFIKGIFDNDEEVNEFFEQYSPKFSGTTLSIENSLTDNDRCISIKPKTLPSSKFEVIIYTNNDTYFEIFNKLDLFVVLSSSDLDAASKLKSKTSKNYLVIVLDDLPEGKSINLNGIRSSSNLLLIGFKIEKEDDIYSLFDSLSDLDDIWSEIGSEEHTKRQAELITKLTSKIGDYRPKASITYTTVNSFLICMVDYFGTHIKCTRFWPILSTFSNIKTLASDFQAQMTVTETITYKNIESLVLKDLILFPVSINPPNIFAVNQIDLIESQWSLTLEAVYNDPGFNIEGNIKYTIMTEKVKGQLSIYTLSARCIFNAPDNKDRQKLRGISYTALNEFSIEVKKIPGMIVFEDQIRIEKLNKIKNIFNGKTLSEMIHSILKRSELSLFENELESGNFKFTGNWNKVDSIDGTIEIDTANQKAVIDDIPIVVAQVLDVKSQSSINMNTDCVKIDFSQPQVVSQAKTIRFSNKETKVTFTNLTFEGNSPKLSLFIGNLQSKVVANHVLLKSGVSATVTGENEVKESFEFDPESSLFASPILSKDPRLQMNYRLGVTFGSIPDSIEPKSIVLNYIGEIESAPSYSSYLGIVKKVKTFTGNDHSNRCKNWKEKTVLASDYYPEFRQEGSIVAVICNDSDETSSLAIKVTAVPVGDVEIVEPDDDEGIDNETEEKDGGKGKGKKFPVAAIIGIVVGVIVVVAIVCVLVWFFVFRKKKKELNESSKGEDVPENVPDKKSEEEFSVGIVEDVTD